MNQDANKTDLNAFAPDVAILIASFAMPDQASLFRTMDLSNLRLRAWLYAHGLRDCGTRASNDLGVVAGVDVRLNHFAEVSIGEFHSALQDEFQARAELQEFVVTFHDTDSRRWETFTLEIGRHGKAEVDFRLFGGLPLDTERAVDLVEQAFIPVGATVEFADHQPADADIDEDYWNIALVANDTSVTMGAVRSAMLIARSSICTYRGEAGPDRRAEVRSHILDGQFEQVFGEVESDWLECKSELQLGSRTGNEELLKTVSGFANGHKSAILIVGLQTANRDGCDRIIAVTPVPKRVHTAETYRKLIDDHIVPGVRGLEVHVVDTEGGVVVVVSIPAQREQDKLFAVSSSAGKASAANEVVSFYQRRGDRTVPLSVADIQYLISAGYQHAKTNMGTSATAD